MQKHRWIGWMMGVAIWGGLAAGTALAAGLDNNGVGTRGMEMMAAFTAVADDADAVFYNPAGLAMIPEESIQLDAYAAFLSTNYSLEPEGGTKLESKEPATLPGIFVSKTFKDFGVGLGCYIPYGGASLRYKDNPMPGYEIFSGMAAAAISAAGGVKLLPNLALGLTASMYYGAMQSKVEVLQQELNVSGLAGYGAEVGLLYRPVETFKAGLVYKTPIAMKLPGTMKTSMGSADAEVSLTIPSYIVAGVAQRLGELWLSLDAWYMAWGSMDHITTKIQGVESEQKTHYKNALQINLGAEFPVMPELTLRGGLKYSQGGAQDEGLGLMSIDLDTVAGGLGVGYKVWKDIELNLSGFYLKSLPKEVENVKYASAIVACLAGVTAGF